MIIRFAISVTARLLAGNAVRILANRTDMSKKDDSPDCEWLYTFGSAKHGESVLFKRRIFI